MKYKIKAQWHYYIGTLNAPSDGDLLNYIGDFVTYNTVKECYEHLKEYCNCNVLDEYGCAYYNGQYVCAHGQYSRPEFFIVSTRSGKTNQEIRNECKKLLN